MKNTNGHDIFDQMAAEWQGPAVPRSDIARFTGGMVKPQTLANLDQRGVGPPGKFKFGKKVGYPKTDLVQWLRKRAESPAVRADHIQHPTQREWR